MKKTLSKKSGMESRPAWCSSSRRATTIGLDATFGHVVNTKYQPQVEAGRKKKGLNATGRRTGALGSKAKRRITSGRPQRRVAGGGNPASLIRDLASRTGGEATVRLFVGGDGGMGGVGGGGEVRTTRTINISRRRILYGWRSRMRQRKRARRRQAASTSRRTMSRRWSSRTTSCRPRSSTRGPS